MSSAERPAKFRSAVWAATRRRTAPLVSRWVDQEAALQAKTTALRRQSSGR